jgi:putative membrane protein (TIGR04086 family)
MMNMRWGWILLGGFLVEVAIFAIGIPLALAAGQESFLYVAPIASFFASFAFGLWIARKASRRRVLHGAFVGVVAILIYVGMSLGQREPIVYIIAHVLKVLGGAAGGFVAFRHAAGAAIPNSGGPQGGAY